MLGKDGAARSITPGNEDGLPVTRSVVTGVQFTTITRVQCSDHTPRLLRDPTTDSAPRD